MAKTESTAVTRLIELAHSRPIEGDFDWFGTPKGKPKKRLERERTARSDDDVTQVVRVPGRKLQASPATVIGAFFAGVLTVALTMLVTKPSSPPAPAPALAPVPPPPTTVVAALPDDSAPSTESRAPSTVHRAPSTEFRAPSTVPRAPSPESRAPSTVPSETVAVETASPAPPRTLDRPSRPARTRAPASFARPRAGRPAAAKQEGGSPLSELRINSKPPCQLYIDGRDMGWTPQRGISVAPGRHTVLFRNREQGVERKVIIDAKVGEVHRVIRDFTEP